MKKIVSLLFISYLSFSSFSINSPHKKDSAIFVTDVIFPFQKEYVYGYTIVELENAVLGYPYFRRMGWQTRNNYAAFNEEWIKAK